MNDPVIERVAREDPAHPGGAAGQPDQADVSLRRVLAAIDRQDAAHGAPRASGPPRWHRLGGVAVAAVAVAVTAAVAVVALVALGHHRAATNPAVRPPRTLPGSGDAVRARPAGSVRVGGGPAALLASGGSLWVAGDGYVDRLDAATGQVEQTVRVTTRVVGPAQLAIGAGSVWAAYTGASAVLRIDSGQHRPAANIGLAGESTGGGVAVADGRVWVSRTGSGDRGDVVTVDPRTDRLAGAAVPVGSGPGQLAVGRGSVWVQNTSGPYPGTSRIDPRLRRARSAPFSGTPAFGFGSVWVVPDGPTAGSSLRRYDLTTRRATPVARLPQAAAAAFGAGRVWVVSYPRSGPAATYDPIRATATLTQVDPGSHRVVGTPIRLPALQPTAIAISGDNLWIADYHSGRLLHFRLTG